MADTNRSNIKDKIKFLNDHNGTRIEEGDDIVQEELETLGDFLNCITQRNEFSVKSGVSKFKLKDSSGRPSPVETGGNGAERFTEQDEGHFETIGTTGDFDEFPRPGIDGHEFLKTIEGTPTDKSGQLQIKTKEDKYKTTQRISNILKKNRFHPEDGTPFIPRGSTSTDADERPFAKAQTQFGLHEPNSQNVSFDDMKKIGLSLMLRATGEFFGADGDPDNLEAGASSLVPGSAQLAATRLDPKSMYAENVFNGEQFRKDDLISLEQDSILKGSFGNLNNFQEPFAGLHPTGMVVLANALVISLKLVLEGIARLMGLASQNKPAESEHGPFPIGQHRNSERGILGRFSFTDLGIANTRNNFSVAFDRGLDVFFSADASGQSFKRVIESPGFYAILVRSIIRSANLIVEDIGDVKENSSNPFQVAQNIAGVLGNLKSSKIISIINVFASIGDNVIELEKQGLIGTGLFGELATGGIPDKLSSIDLLPENAATRVGKVRGKEGELPIAWRNSSSPSLYVLPESILKSEIGLANENIKPSNLFSAGDEKSDVMITSRISNDAVQEIEEELDAEYVPFYFHDLRTNEIISFHAFLSSLNEQYNANWESSTPYGRVDPIRIYKNTERTLSLEFNIVSTSHQDFNEMWRKINKLVSMLYPQWSKGRKLTAGENTFIQPFSQIPTASPIIRLRIGDLIKTNYSRFGLARLFGLGTEDFKVSNQELNEEFSDKKEKIFKIKKRMTTKPSGPNDTNGGFKVGERAFLNVSNKGYEPEFDGDEKLLLNHQAEVEIKSAGFDIDNGVIYKVQLTSFDMDGPARKFLGKRFFAFFEDLELSATEPFRIVTGNEDISPPETTIEDIHNFFKKDENAITRSFESTAGKGLAGVIPSLSFNWFDPVWEVSRYGSRAPMWCKATMSFNAIHDLPPGLSHDGHTNGVYNVGDIMKGAMGSPYQNDLGENIFDLRHWEIPGFLRNS